MPITTARQERREELLEWATRSQDGIRISHSVFRHFEQCFPEVQYFEGVPFVPWKALKAKLSSPRGLIDVIATYFKGERLIVDGLGSRTLSTSAIRRDDISRNEKTFLRLEHVLKVERMFKALKSLMNDWYRETLYPGLVGNPSREYAVHHGPFVTGVCYKTPRPGTSGIYVLHCGATFSFNNRAYDGPFFLLKKGQSIDIAGRVLHHKAASSMYGSKGTVKFLFGLELKSGDLNDAETLLKAKLTDLGFSRFTVSDN